MFRSPARRGTRAVALALLTMAALFAGACGKDGSGGPTDPIPNDPDPSDPTGPAEWPAPVGYTVYAVDIRNNFLTFGTESFDVLSGAERISGLPILKRIIGIVYRPSDGKLYGVGNDSRVYTINPATAVATPVSETQFSPKIVDFFEVHFAMALEPNGNRVRLISTEGGGSWSISLDDGTATERAPMQFVAGDPHEGETPHIAALMFVTAPAGVRMAGSMSDPCTETMYMIDPDMAEYIGSCGDTGDLGSLGPLPETWARCMETLVNPDGSVNPSEGNPYGFGGSFVAAMRGVDEVNSWGTVNDDGTVTWHGMTRGEAIQTATTVPSGTSDLAWPSSKKRVQYEPQLSVAEGSDPRARCGGGS